MNYYIKKLTSLPSFYFAFILFLFINFFLNVLTFNENFLIGSLFTIGFFTVLQILHSTYSANLITQLTLFNQVYFIRRFIIYKYKLFLTKIIFFYLIFFLSIRYKLVLIKFKKIFIFLLSKFDNLAYVFIFFKLLFTNILCTYFFLEKSILFNIQFTSIKATYKLFF